MQPCVCAQTLEAVGTIWGSGPEPLSFLISPGAQEAPSVPTLRVAPAPHLPAAQTRQASPPPCLPWRWSFPESLVMEPQPVVTGLEKFCSLALPDRQIGTDGREEKARATSAVTGGLALHWPQPGAALLRCLGRAQSPDPDNPSIQRPSPSQRLWLEVTGTDGGTVPRGSDV